MGPCWAGRAESAYIRGVSIHTHVCLSPGQPCSEPPCLQNRVLSAALLLLQELDVEALETLQQAVLSRLQALQAREMQEDMG